MINAFIIAACVFTFCAGFILGGAITRPEVRTVEMTRPTVDVEEVPDEGEAYIIIEAPKHRHPLTSALIFDGDAVRIFREQRRV